MPMGKLEETEKANIWWTFHLLVLITLELKNTNSDDFFFWSLIPTVFRKLVQSNNLHKWCQSLTITPRCKSDVIVVTEPNLHPRIVGGKLGRVRIEHDEILGRGKMVVRFWHIVMYWNHKIIQRNRDMYVWISYNLSSQISHKKKYSGKVVEEIKALVFPASLAYLRALVRYPNEISY